MAQKLIQTQEQTLQQVQKLTQQQMLQVRLMEMPVAELEENVNAELDDNPALETADDGDIRIGGDDSADARDSTSADAGDATDTPDADDFEARNDKEERESALDAALENIGSDDEMPTTYVPGNRDGADYEEMVYGDTVSFYDKLREQMGELSLTDHQRDIMEYVIGSLDDDGLLRKDDDTLADELEIFHNIECTPEEVAVAVANIQSFDPPGIGAHSLQECLLLQEARRPDSRAKAITTDILRSHYKNFTSKNWEAIKEAMNIGDGEIDLFRQELRHLNPKPGASLGEAEGRSMQQITPDFIVETEDDGTIRLYLNSGDVPELKVSPSFTEMVAAYRNNRKSLNRQEKEALLYAKEKVEKAQGYIEAIRQRRLTLTKTMRAIIDWQRKFFLDGDESNLRPMVLKDLAAKTGLDISTISRVCNVKYVQTNWGTFPLRFFFNSGYVTSGGEELSTRIIKAAMREVIDAENKKSPLSDDAISKMMAQRGYPIARRTVAKYREQMDIPPAKQRRE